MRILNKIIFALTLWAVPSWASLSVGQTAPDFTLTDMQGNTFKLSEQKGQTVLLYFVGYS